jgi:hypothetical protein
MLTVDYRKFDPDAYAQIEADTWVAYYHHNFFRMFKLMLRLNYLLFRPSYRLALLGAYHTTRAAIVFRLTKGHEDNAKVLKHLTRFFKLISNYSIQPFDYKKTAEQELLWWMIDRYPGRYKESRAEIITAAMATMCRIEPEKLRNYGKKRSAAMDLIGDYHHNTSAKVDWPKIDKLLHEAYRSLHDATQ